MDSPILLDKILELEKQLLELKSQFPAKSTLARRCARAKAVLDGVLGYWVPLALIVGLVVNWWFGVGFFENIQNVGINKKSSDYYAHIGEKLMSHAEFAAAADSFERSLKINPNNINATHGLMKAQVLNAVGTNETFKPIVVEDKLAYLRDIFGKDDYLLLYWEGVLRRQISSSSDLQVPENLFLRSIKANPSFPGSHLELGNTYLLSGDIDKAVAKFNDVIALDSRFAGALSNLGYCNLVLSNFEADEKARKAVLWTAATHLNQARISAALPETDLRLGDTYLFMNQYRAAGIAHQNALESLQRNTDPKSVESIEVLFVFPPSTVNDARKRELAITVGSKADLKALVLYSLSFDYAGDKDFANAQKYFTEAKAVDARRLYSSLVAHQINALLRLPSLSNDTRTWLSSHMYELCKDKKMCLPDIINGSQNERRKK